MGESFKKKLNHLSLWQIGRITPASALQCWHLIVLSLQQATVVSFFSALKISTHKKKRNHRLVRK